MDGAVTKKNFADVSTQTPVHKSTQTDPVVFAEEGSGTLGHHTVRIAEGNVNFRSNELAGKEIRMQSYQDRITVQILPVVMDKRCSSWEENNKFSGVSFHSSSLNEAPVYEEEDNNSAALSWELDPAKFGQYEDSPALINVSTQRQSYKDSVFSNQLKPDMDSSEWSAQGECSGVLDSFDDSQVASGSIVSTEAGSDSALGAISQVLLVNGEKIKKVAQSICDKNRTEKISTIIFEQLNTYKLSEAPAWFNNRYCRGARAKTMSRTQTWVIENCSLVIGFNDVKSKESSKSVFLSKNELTLNPAFIALIERDIECFSSLAEVSTMMTNLKRSILSGFLNRKTHLNAKESYETLTLKKKPDNFKKYIWQNGSVDFFKDIDPACRFFVNAMCNLIVSSPKKANYIQAHKKLEKNLEKYHLNPLYDSGFSLELLRSCIKFNLAVQLIEDFCYNSGIIADCRFMDPEKQKTVQDFSFLEPEVLSSVEESLQSVMKELEKEAIEIKETMSDSIDKMPRRLGGKTFEEKFLRLKNSGSGDYIDEPFTTIRKRLKTILQQRPSDKP